MYTFQLLAIGAAVVTLAHAQRVSTSARCGPAFGLTCQGSSFGNCCSQYSYCGSTSGYCGTGCQQGWGTCNASPLPSLSRVSTLSTVTRSSAVSSPTLKVSTNARCGKNNGFTCQGSRYGNCCSQYSYCGSTVGYCGTGCQQGFGKCNVALSSSSVVSLSISQSSSQAQSSSAPSSSPATSSALNSSPSPSPSLSPSSSVSSPSIPSASSSPSPSSSSTPSPLPSSSSTPTPTPTPSSSPAPSSTPSSSLAPSSTPSSFPTPNPTSSNSGVSSSASSTPSASPSVILQSSTPISSTSSPTPTVCVQPNPFINGGFNQGHAAGWTTDGEGGNYVASARSGGHESAGYFGWTKTASGTGFYVLSLAQTVIIPITIQAELSFWVRLTLPSGTANVDVHALDGNNYFGTSISLTGNESWVQLRTRIRTVTAGTHLFKIWFAHDGIDVPNGSEFAVDEVTLIYSVPAGPGGACSVVGK